MTGIRVDGDLCTRCGICTEVCPINLIEMPGSTGKGKKAEVPHIPDKKISRCIECGHCEAFCPAGALAADVCPGKTRAEELGPDTIGSGALGKYLMARRSIRAYRPEPVDKDTLLTLLGIARYAATGSNAQPLEWTVIHNPETIHTLAGMTIDWMREHTHDNHPISRYLPAHIENWDKGIDGICRNAPEIIVAHVPAGNRMAAIDAIIALTYVDVAAPSYGVGTCWAGLLTMAARDSCAIAETLGIPEGREIGYAMLAGYPKYRPARIPPGRKPLAVSWRE